MKKNLFVFALSALSLMLICHPVYSKEAEKDKASEKGTAESEQIIKKANTEKSDKKEVPPAKKTEDAVQAPDSTTVKTHAIKMHMPPGPNPPILDKL